MDSHLLPRLEAAPVLFLYKPSFAFFIQSFHDLLTVRHPLDISSLSSRGIPRIPSITERHLLPPESFPGKLSVCLTVNLPFTRQSTGFPCFVTYTFANNLGSFSTPVASFLCMITLDNHNYYHMPFWVPACQPVWPSYCNDA